MIPCFSNKSVEQSTNNDTHKGEVKNIQDVELR